MLASPLRDRVAMVANDRGDDLRPDPGARLIEVPQPHRFDEAALALHLRRHGVAFGGPLRVRLFQGGQSNPTYLLEFADRRLVLRKKPPGPLLPSAHQIEREYRVQQALRESAVPVPKQFLLCEDPTVIGTPFYVMAFVEGRIYERAEDIGNAQRTARLYEASAETLAALHAVDWQAAGLSDYGRGEGYLARQVDRWTRQYRASVTGEPDPTILRLVSWLQERMPRESATAIVHGDFRIGNLVIDVDAPRIAALLDWELSTLGDPLADLAYLCVPYHLAPHLPGVAGLRGLDLGRLGVPSEEALLASYCRHSGRSELPHWSFYRSFVFFRLAAVVQGVAARATQGNATSGDAAAFESMASTYLDLAWTLAQSSPSTR